MSMHMEGPWLSTGGKKKGKKKFRNADEARKARELDESWKELQKKWAVEAEDKKRKRAMSAEPLDGYVPLHPYKEQNIDYKKEWVLAQKQSKVYESWWIKYRDMAVKLDKELKELKGEK